MEDLPGRWRRGGEGGEGRAVRGKPGGGGLGGLVETAFSVGAGAGRASPPRLN